MSMQSRDRANIQRIYFLYAFKSDVHEVEGYGQDCSVTKNVWAIRSMEMARKYLVWVGI